MSVPLGTTSDMLCFVLKVAWNQSLGHLQEFFKDFFKCGEFKSKIAINHHTLLTQFTPLFWHHKLQRPLAFHTSFLNKWRCPAAFGKAAYFVDKFLKRSLNCLWDPISLTWMAELGSEESGAFPTSSPQPPVQWWAHTPCTKLLGTSSGSDLAFGSGHVGEKHLKEPLARVCNLQYTTRAPLGDSRRDSGQLKAEDTEDLFLYWEVPLNLSKQWVKVEF